MGAQDQTTLNSSDILDGGAGDDSLVVNMTGAQYLGGATIKNIETLQVGTNLAASAFDMNVNQGAFEVTGVETIVYDQITVGETLNVQNIVPVAADGGTPTLHWANEANSTAGTAGATYRQASTSGAADDQAITLENVTTGTLNIGPGIESFTIESAGTIANNTLANSGNRDTVASSNDNAADLVSSGSLTKVVLTGGVAIGKTAGVVVSTTNTTNGLTDRTATVDTGITTNSTASNLLSVESRVTEVDATEMTGAANVRFVPKTNGADTNVSFLGGAAGDYVEFERGNVTATGEAGDDTFAFVVPVGTVVNSGFTSADSLTGGEGSDTVQIGLNGSGTYNLNTTEFNNKTGIDVLDLRGTTNNVTLADAFVAGADTTLTVRTDKIVQTAVDNSANPTNSSTQENRSVSTINLAELADNRAINILGGSGQERVVGDNASINANSSIDGGLGMDSLTVINTAVLDANDLANVSNLEMLNLVDNVTGASTFNVTITESFLAKNTTGTTGTKTFVVASEAAAGGVVLTAGDTVTIDVSDLYSAGALKTSVTSANYKLNLQDLVASGATVNLVQGGVTLASYAAGALTAGALPVFGDATTVPSTIAYTVQTDAVTGNILAVLPNSGTGTGGDGGAGGGGGGAGVGNTFTFTAATQVLNTSSNVGTDKAGTTTYLGSGNDTIVGGTQVGATTFVTDSTATDADTLSFTSTAAVAPTIAGIETINMASFGGGINLLSVTGLNTLNISGAGATAVTSVANGSSQIHLTSGYTGQVTATALVGNAAASTLTAFLDGTAAGSTFTFADSGADQLATLTLNTSANSTINTIDGDANSLPNVVLAGAGNLTVANFDNLAATSSVTAATMTGALSVTNVEAWQITGSSQADTFGSTTASAASVNGGAGNDTFNFGALLEVTDTLTGGLGNDTLNVTNDTATTDLDNVTGMESIVLAAGNNYAYTPSNNSAFDLDATLTSVAVNASALAAANTLTFLGGFVDAHALALTGGAGADTLTGGSQADTITGGLGADSITGGLGIDSINLTEATLSTDIVVLATDVASRDTITGFTAGATTGDNLKIAMVGNNVAIAADATSVLQAHAATGNLTMAGGATLVSISVENVATFSTDGTSVLDALVTGAGAGTITLQNAADNVVFLVNNGTDIGVYYGGVTTGNANTALLATEIELVGTLSSTALAAMVAGNVIGA